MTMPNWMLYLLVFGNLVNLAFDGTIIVCKFTEWCKRRRYEKWRGIVRR